METSAKAQLTGDDAPVSTGGVLAILAFVAFPVVLFFAKVHFGLSLGAAIGCAAGASIAILALPITLVLGVLGLGIWGVVSLVSFLWRHPLF